MINLETKKYQLISRIMSSEDEVMLSELEKFMNKISVHSQIFIPIKKELSIDEMVKNQRFKGIDEKTFYKLADDVNVEESLEELLKLCN